MCDRAGDGAYPSWPAFSCEALCYIDGNCSSAFAIMATFAAPTFEGPFGQCHQVPIACPGLRFRDHADLVSLGNVS